ncbi:DUF3861 domain-containing protein [Limibacter armeniacum]|uniref:DUF3861 domain-containing protein n=1 Tax=Limibacter armeniacum TaxID=466084 RepID=UPI002FE6B401
MNKRANKYKMNLNLVSLANGEKPELEKAIELEFDNHDEIFGLIERSKEKNLFDNPQQSVEFTIGLKLFSEVMLKNRNHPLFEAFAPAFRDFMKKLKSM